MFCGLCRSKNSKRKKQNQQDASTDSDAYHVVGESNVDCDQNSDLYDVVDDNKTTTVERKQRKRSLIKNGEVEQDLYDPVGENNRVDVKEYDTDGSDDASDTEMVCNVAYEPFVVGGLKLSTTDDQDVYDSMEDGDDNNRGPNVGSPTSFAKNANIRKIAQTMPRMAPDMSQLAFSAASKGKELLSRRRTSPGSIKNNKKRNTLSAVDQTIINDSLQSINKSISNDDDLSDVSRQQTRNEEDDDSISTRSRNAEVDLISENEDHTSSNISSTSKVTNDDVFHDATGDDEPTTDAQNMLKDKPDVCSRKLSVRNSNIQTETEVYEPDGIDNAIDDVIARIPGKNPNYLRECVDEEENGENTQVRNTNKAEDATKTVINNTLGEKETDCDYNAEFGNVAHEPCSEVGSIKLSTVSSQFVFFTTQSFCKIEKDVVLHETLSKRQEKYAPISRVNSREVRRFSL